MTKGRKKETHPLGERAEELLRELTPDVSGQELGEIVGKALLEGGIKTLSGFLDGPGWAVWSDDFEPWVSNPLLVETKTNCQGEAQLAAVIGQLEQDIKSRGAAWGLLIYSGAPLRSLRAKAQATPVLVISIQDFLHALKTVGVADVVLRLKSSELLVAMIKSKICQLVASGTVIP